MSKIGDRNRHVWFSCSFLCVGVVQFFGSGGFGAGRQRVGPIFFPILAPRTAFVSKYRGDQQRVLAKAPWGQSRKAICFSFYS
jgi:hypothetical protein